jgi:RNA polymerase sigma factor (sigma-70 family)
MKQVTEERRDVLERHLALPEERARLVRFCARLAGDGDVAEDLAQDALLEALRQADTLQNPEVWRSWMFGIARNMYLRWNRRHVREMARRAPYFEGPSAPHGYAGQNAALELQTALERQEIATLLGRALGTLPAQTRHILIQHYVDEMPQAEIAARLGINENAAAVRLHRGKQSLRRVLATDLRADAATYGLVAPSAGAEVWQETRLWCPFCGKTHLHARPLTDAGDREFRISCRACYFTMGPRVIDFPSDCIFGHNAFDPTKVLAGVRGDKPALPRLSAGWGDYLEQGQRRGAVKCLGCGQSLGLSTARPAHLRPHPYTGFHINCPRCKKIHVLLPSAFALCAAPVQQFWRQHPRMRLLPARAVPASNAFALSFESVTASARLDIIFDRTTYRMIETVAQ